MGGEVDPRAAESWPSVPQRILEYKTENKTVDRTRL